MRTKLRSTCLTIFAASLGYLLSPGVFANTSSVFSPDVSAGDQSFEYRSSFEPGEDGDPDVFAHRLHYQQSFNDRTRWRIMGVQSDKDEGLEFRYTRLELQHQFHEDEEAGFDSALRFELQIAEGDDTPSRARVAWTGKVDATPRWQLRANFLTGKQFDSGAKSGLLLETRWQATYKLDGGARIGLEMFNDLNTTADVGSFDEQEHTLGPIVKFGLGKGWRAEASYHAGLSDDASDDTFRLHIRYKLR